MNQPQFQKEFSRLVGQFGKTTYGEERIKLIYEEVKDQDPHWFS